MGAIRRVCSLSRHTLAADHDRVAEVLDDLAFKLEAMCAVAA